MTKKLRAGVLLTALCIVFVGMFLVFGPGVYNDSDQYIKMHIHREPLYPLFLALLRRLFGEELWLTAMGVLQNLLAAVSVFLFSEYAAKKFSLHLWEELVVIGLELMPHMITKYCSSLHLFITNSVMSEALCIPLFTLFMLEGLKLLTEEKKKARKASARALLLAFLLSLTRSQMMITILLWMLAALARLTTERKAWKPGRLWRYLTAVLAVTILVFAARAFTVKCYNLVFNGHFINNTYGTVNTLTNILYAADREDGENIEEESARDFFYRMYDLTEERQANYKYAGSSWKEKTEHIEEWHDTVKYEMIEDVFYQTYDKAVTSDYIEQNLMADEEAGRIIRGILPKCFPRWFGNYLLIAGYGLIRSIGVVHPVINWLVLLIYLSAIGMSFLLLRKTGKRKEQTDSAVWFLGLALFAILANAFAVALTIMALSRYMIYGFATFYAAYFILLITWVRQRKEEKHGI